VAVGQFADQSGRFVPWAEGAEWFVSPEDFGQAFLVGPEYQAAANGGESEPMHHAEIDGSRIVDDAAFERPRGFEQHGKEQAVHNFDARLRSGWRKIIANDRR
jgi:hypothetical protein